MLTNSPTFTATLVVGQGALPEGEIKSNSLHKNDYVG